jgi:DNA-binding CsgD family transcriptional regulator
MSARRAPFIAAVGQRPEPIEYFSHRTATGATAELLVSEELDVCWINAAALTLAARPGVFSLTSGRMILPSRAQEELFLAFLSALDAPGVWLLNSGDGRWLVRAEPIAPPDAPRAFLLSLHRMDAAERYLWADVAAATGLTVSETRVVKLLVEGLRLDDAAARLGISVQTARTHVRRSYLKLGASSREEMFAVVLAYRFG